MLSHCCRARYQRLLIVLAVALTTAAADGEPVELLPNGGCEKIDEQLRPLYFGVQNSGEIVSIRECRSGDRAIRLIARPHEWNCSIFTTPNPASYPQDDLLRINIATGGLYRASAWVRGKGVFQLGVQQWPSVFGSKMSEPLTLSDEWQRISLDFRTTEPDVLSTNLQFRLDGANAVADVDDVSFSFDSIENPGIEHFPPTPSKALVLRVEGRQTRTIELFADGKPVAIARDVARLEISEGLHALAIRAVPSGVNAGVRVRILDHPETDGRWRASSEPTAEWRGVEHDDRSWPIVSAGKDGYMWAADWRGLSRTKPGHVCFRQILLWNETHVGPNRCILPRARQWGFSRGGFENLTLALYSPLPYSLADYDFVLDVPPGFELFGKAGDYYTRHVLNQKPSSIVVNDISKGGTQLRRHCISYPESTICGDAAPHNIFTQYSLLPVRLTSTFREEKTEFRFHRRAKGNFTELEQRIPIQVLPPINGRQPKHFMISAYVGMPLGSSSLSPEHMSAFVQQAARAGWTHVSVSVPAPGCQGWGDEWLAYQNRYLSMCRANGIQAILWPWKSFPITGSLVEPSVPPTLLDWVRATPDAQARYFNDSPRWNEAGSNMYCPTFVATDGADQFRSIVKEVWSGMLSEMGGANIIWTDDERPIFTPNGIESYCFCDRCKAAFRKFAHLGDEIDLSDESVFNRYNKQWRLFWADAWFRGVHGQLKQAANDLGKKYMLYTWNGADDLWRSARSSFDIAFPGLPGSNVMSGRSQRICDDSMHFYRKDVGLRRVHGQTFALINAGVQKNAWAMQEVVSRDGYVDAKSWKSQLLRLAATLGGGVDLGENPIDYAAGCHFWIGEATRVIATFDEFFRNGRRSDDLATSDQIAYPNLLVLTRGEERLVLLFNEGEEALEVTLRNRDVKPGQRAQLFEQDTWGDAGSVEVTIPPRDATVVYVR